MARSGAWTVSSADIQRWRYRWYARLLVERGDERLTLPMTGGVAQWFEPGDVVEVDLEDEATRVGFTGYRLSRVVNGERVPVWPVYTHTSELERRSPVSGEVLYTYRIRVREATHESDYVTVVELEQYHYAATEPLVATWYCPRDEIVVRANARPECPQCGNDMRFRGEGLGHTLVQFATEWVEAYRVPEMRRAKAVVETVATMARYNPFFERAGFRYLWDTASGRPVLYRGLTPHATRLIDRFLATDPVARVHGGRLYRPALQPVPPLSGPITLHKVTKGYRSELTLDRVPRPVREVLAAFGVERRVVEQRVLRNLSLSITPGHIVVLAGASGAGKTTLLRLLWAAAQGSDDPRAQPDEGHIEVPSGTRAAAYLPGEIEPDFGGRCVLEAVAALTGDATAAMHVLHAVGLSDAVLVRATIDELSTGQRERASLAYLVASGANVLLLDEFCAHLDAVLARRVARTFAALVRRLGITTVVASHRAEAIAMLEPDRALVIGYGGVVRSM